MATIITIFKDHLAEDQTQPVRQGLPEHSTDDHHRERSSHYERAQGPEGDEASCAECQAGRSGGDGRRGVEERAASELVRSVLSARAARPRQPVQCAALSEFVRRSNQTRE